MAMGLFIFLLAGNNLRAQVDFIKHVDNPIFVGYDDGPSNVNSPVVIYDDGVYKMWFEGHGNSYNDRQIFYSESEEGIDWDENEEPVISSGDPGDWNFEKKPGSVIRMEDTLKMWYSASSDGFNWDMSIGYAWRHIDSPEWTLLDEPVLEHDISGSWDETGVFYPVVYYDTTAAEDEKYKMWYHGFEGTSVYDTSEEGYAYSSDGINWTKYDENPVITLGASGSYYDTWVIATSVLFYEDEYHLYFTGWDGTSTSPWKYFTVGHATSANGTVWDDVDISPNAVLDVGADGEWDWRSARYGSVLFVDNTFKMWYEGLGSAYKIGYASDDLTLGISDLNSTLTKQIIISPNPTNDITTINYHLATASTTSIIIYNQQGQLISTLVDEKQQAGDHEIKFDSSGFPSGIYFCVIKTMDRIQTQKMVKM